MTYKTLQIFRSLLGISKEPQVQFLYDLFEKELLEPDIKMQQDVKDWSFIRISGFGLYTIRILVTKFAYIEAIMLDTPISDLAIHRRIAGLYLERHKPSLHQRLLCVKDFIKYLKNEESIEQMRIQTSGISSECPEIMSQIVMNLQEDFMEIEKHIAENPFT